MDSTGLLYYHARYYNPVLARFISADSIIPGQSDTAGTVNPQHLNRYAYVNNNPINRTDPTGHDWEHFAPFALEVAQGALATINSVVETSTPDGAADAGVNLGMAIGRDPAGFVQGVKDQVTTGIRGGANLVNDPAGAAATLDEHSGELGQVMGQALATAALAKALPDSGACSFRADTPVATEDGETAIGDLRVGDHVLAYNQTTGDTGSYTVTKVLVHTDPIIEYVTFDGEQLETTPEHPFYTIEHGWTQAGQLHFGDHVRRANGTASRVESFSLAAQPQVMYNLTVAQAHTFFVGWQRLLVHNSCGDALANTAAAAHRTLRSAGLAEATVAAGQSTEGGITLAAFHSTAEGTESAVQVLRGKGWNVLDPPVGRSPAFHAERQLENAGFTEIGISRQQGMCDACKAHFATRPDVTVTNYRR